MCVFIPLPKALLSIYKCGWCRGLIEEIDGNGAVRVTSTDRETDDWIPAQQHLFFQVALELIIG